MSTNWEVQAARLSMFGFATAGFATFDAVTGALPAQTMTRPVDQSKLEVAPIGKTFVNISLAPQRSDLQLSPNISPLGVSSGPPTMGSPKETVRELLGLGHKWVAQVGDGQRVALALTLGHTTASLDAALDLVATNVAAFSKGTTPILDFLLQINRPRPSKIDKTIEINRLCKWQAVQFQLIQITAIGASATSQTKYSAQLDLDINTSVKTAHVSGTKISSLIDELGELALEIAEKGDVP